VVSLSITNCDASSADSVVISIDPTSSGVFKSACQNIGVAANTPGYSLSIKASSTDLLYQNPTSIIPAPIVPSTDRFMDDPAVLPNDTWGFAVEKQVGMDSSTGFDTNYTSGNPNNKYALLPTTGETIYQTYKALGETPAPLSNFTAYYGAKLTLATIAGEYKTTITYTAIGEEVSEPEEIACVTGKKFKKYIGDIRNAGAATASWAVGDSGIANDIRGGGQQYCIGKLADDNIWMLNNLKLGSLTKSINLTPADTNITSNWTLPQIDNTASSYFDVPHLYAFTSDQSGFSSDIPNAEEEDITSSNFAGYHYNWCAAKGGTVESCTDLSTHPVTTSIDICPANWRMPIGGNSGEFVVLSNAMEAFSGIPAHWNFVFQSPFRGTLAGIRAELVWVYQDTTGQVLSASHDSYTYSPYIVRGLSFTGSGSLLTDTGFSRDYGFSIRCLLQ
jgi:hypothetical protein